MLSSIHQQKCLKHFEKLICLNKLLYNFTYEDPLNFVSIYFVLLVSVVRLDNLLKLQYEFVKYFFLRIVVSKYLCSFSVLMTI